jgi:shikimate kinase
MGTTDVDDKEPAMPSFPVSPPPGRSHLACIGLMGAGKSTVGRLVAERLGWGFVDVDETIEALTHCTVQQLWEHGGEDAYRPFERDVVVDALGSPERTVLAAPGGVVLDRDATAAIAAQHVTAVYLRALPATLAQRIDLDADHERPLVDGHAEAVMRSLFTARDHCYEDLADHIVQVDDLTPEQAADCVLDLLLAVPR